MLQFKPKHLATRIPVHTNTTTHLQVEQSKRSRTLQLQDNFVVGDHRTQACTLMLLIRINLISRPKKKSLNSTLPFANELDVQRESDP